MGHFAGSVLFVLLWPLWMACLPVILLATLTQWLMRQSRPGWLGYIDLVGAK